MSNLYPLITVLRETLDRSEKFRGGAEEKYKIPWIQTDLTREQIAIFKIDNEPSELSRVWIEKLGAELAIAMGLPTATYEMCQDEQDLRAILSPSYMKLEAQERSGMTLMQEVLNDRERLYTIENVLAVFDRLDIGLPSGYNSLPEISTAKDLFVGYLLHDYWIDNPDRHDRNWGIQVDLNGNKELLPNYDYGRALVDFPLTNNRFEIFAERLGEVRTCAFVNNGGNKIKMDEMLKILTKINPDATKYWSGRIAQVGQERLDTIFDRFPSNLASPERIEFAKVFIDYNSLRLQQIISNSELVFLEPSELESPALDDSPEPPDDPSEPPRRRPKPPTPPNSPDSLNAPKLPRPQAPNEVDPLQEPNQSSGTSVTLKQIIDLKNYYVKSPEGQQKPESINAVEKFNLFKLQIAQHGKEVTSDPDLKMTNKFFKTFKSDRVTLSAADRANVVAASRFAAEQVQIDNEIAQASSLESKQRSRGFSR